MPTYKNPGIYFEESTLQASAITGANLTAAAFVGTTYRGPTVPTLVTSWTQYLQLFGGFGANSQYLPYAVFLFFANGGRECYVQRILGAGSVVATKTLNDRAGTPLPTLRLDALWPGVWGGGTNAVAGRDTLYVDVTDSGTDRFNIVLRLGSTTDYSTVVERWTDLSMVENDARYAPNIINSLVAGSVFVRATDLNSATVPGATNLDRPALQVGSAFTLGAEGAAVTEADITGAGGLSLLDQIDRPLNINIPGDGVAATHTALMNYCQGRGDCFAVLDPPATQTPTAAATFGGAEAGTNLSYGALYYPWIYVSDPAGGSGATRLLPPGGAILGQYAATDTARGVFKTPAGLGNRLAGTVGVETKLTGTDLGNLNVANVNVIRQIPGAGVVVMGGRTLKPNASDKYISVRRSLIYIRSSLIDSTRFAIFEPNDVTLWRTLQTIISRFLLDFWQSGGLRGNSADEAFYVKCNEENNTGAGIGQGEVHVEIGVALQYPAEFVVIRLAQREVGATVTVTV